MIRIGALVRVDRTRPPPPLDALPMGRAARVLLEEGIEVMLVDAAHDGTVDGYVATPSGWEPSQGASIDAVYDRYPRPRYRADHDALLSQLGTLPLGNPPSLRELSSDKLLSQRHLEARGVRMPAVQADPTQFDACLRAWGPAFAKPRFGAVGAGVERVVPGTPVAPQRLGAIGVMEPTLLQRAVPPPKGWAGISTRTVVQRDEHQAWVCAPPVARRSPSDWVVNVARGAEPVPAIDVLDPQTILQLHAAAQATATALSDHPDGASLLEIGVDAMIDDQGTPWVIEVNTRPWGRLSALVERDPDRWMADHIAVCARPFRALAGQVRAIR